MRRRDIKFLSRDLVKLGRRMDEVAIPTLQELQKRLRDEAKVDYASRGIGRALWGSGGPKRGKPRLSVTVGKPRFSGSGGGYVTKVKAKGMTAFIERGIKTRPHGIRPKRASILRFRVRGQFVFAGNVLHPGGRVKRRPVLRSGMERLKPVAVNLMSRHMSNLFQKVFG